MNYLLPVLTIAGFIWAAAALLYQLYTAWGGGRRDFSQKSGQPLKGMVYNFTIAMLPSHKETIRLHPFAFTTGLIMHAGAFAALFTTLYILAPFTMPRLLTLVNIILLAPALPAAIILIFRRITSRLLKSINTPDDYFAIIATTVFILIALLFHLDVLNQTILLLYAILFLLYFPLGKLRHALFFFVARADYGRRLGYRGVYPVHHNSIKSMETHRK